MFLRFFNQKKGKKWAYKSVFESFKGVKSHFFRDILHHLPTFCGRMAKAEEYSQKSLKKIFFDKGNFYFYLKTGTEADFFAFAPFLPRKKNIPPFGRGKKKGVCFFSGSADPFRNNIC